MADRYNEGVDDRKHINNHAVLPLCSQTIARQLAEILLRGMCEQSYWNPLEEPPCQSPLDDPLRKGANTKTYTLPRRARVYSGEKYGTGCFQLGPLGQEGDVRMVKGREKSTARFCPCEIRWGY